MRFLPDLSTTSDRLPRRTIRLRLTIIYAALFLRRFVPEEIAWAHLDTWAWRDPGKPGRPKGGDALGLRAVFAMLQDRYPQR